MGLTCALVGLLACSPASKAQLSGNVEILTRTGSALSVNDVSTVTVTVTGDNIVSPLSTDLLHDATGWHATMTDIPVGLARFDGKAFDGEANLLYEGDAPNVAINPGATALVALLLQQAHAPSRFQNNAPVIDAVTASANLIAPSAQVAVRGIAHDADGDTLTYHWSANGGSFDAADSAAAVWNAPATTGTYTLTFDATDPAGLKAAVSFTLAVENGHAAVSTVFNTWPTVSGMTATPTRVDTGETTTLSITAADADDDTLTYAWTSDCTGTFSAADAATTDFTLSSLPESSVCTMQATVTDGRGGTNTGTVVLQAGPAPQLSVGPSTVYHSVYNGSGYTLYSFDGSEWATVSSNMPSGTVGSDSYVGDIGGKAYHSVYNGSGFTLYSFDGSAWATVSTNMPSGVASYSYVGVLGGKAYHSLYNGSGFTLYSFDGSAWTALTSSGPENLGSYSYVGVLGGKVYHSVYNGSGSTLYSFDGSTWAAVSSNMPSNVGGGGFIGTLGGKTYHSVYNGSGSTLYSFDGSTWTALTSSVPSGVGGFLGMMGMGSWVGSM
jgi:hypothetical protein